MRAMMLVVVVAALLSVAVARDCGDIVLTGNDGQWWDCNTATSITANGGTLSSFSLSALSLVNGPITFVNNQNLNSLSFPALTAVSGAITIQSNPVLNYVWMGALTQVTGSFTISNDPQLSNFNAQSVTTVGGDYVITQTGFTTGDLTRLQSVGGSIHVENNPSMGSIGIFLSASLQGFYIQSNAVLTQLYAPSLSIVYSFYIQDNPQLSSLTLNNFAYTQDFRWQNNNVPTLSLPLWAAYSLFFGSGPTYEVDLPNLMSVVDLDASFSMAGAIVLPSLTFASDFLSFAGCPRLTAVSIPRLSYLTSIAVENNPTLFDISLPALTTIQFSIYVQNNPQIQWMGLQSLQGLTSSNYITLQYIPTIYSCDNYLKTHFNAVCNQAQAAKPVVESVKAPAKAQTVQAPTYPEPSEEVKQKVKSMIDSHHGCKDGKTYDKKQNKCVAPA